MKNHYQTLGLKADAAQPEIKAAYRKLALAFHPDRNTGSSSGDKFAEIQQAYRVLSDARRKAVYDKFLKIDSEETIGFPDDSQYTYVRQGFSWNILVAAIIVVAFTFLALRCNLHAH